MLIRSWTYYLMDIFFSCVLFERAIVYRPQISFLVRSLPNSTHSSMLWTFFSPILHHVGRSVLWQWIFAQEKAATWFLAFSLLMENAETLSQRALKKELPNLIWNAISFILPNPKRFLPGILINIFGSGFGSS